MPSDRSRRASLVALLVAAAIGFALGWWGRNWKTPPSPESKAHEAAEQIKERVRDVTH